MGSISEPEWLLGRVVSVQPALPFPFSSKPMFGGFFGYADDRAFLSISSVGLAVKLGPRDQEQVLSEGGVRLRYGPDAPESRSYVVLPDGHVADDDLLVRWVVRSAQHVGAVGTT